MILTSRNKECNGCTEIISYVGAVNNNQKVGDNKV